MTGDFVLNLGNDTVHRGIISKQNLSISKSEPDLERTGDFPMKFRSGWGEYQHKWKIPDQISEKSMLSQKTNVGLYGLPDANIFRQIPNSRSGSLAPAASIEPENSSRNIKSRQSWPLPRSISVEPSIITSRRGRDVGTLSHNELKQENERLKRENQTLLHAIAQEDHRQRTSSSRSSSSLSIRRDLLAENERLADENRTLLVTIGEDENEGRGRPTALESSWALRSHNKPASYIHHLNKGYLVGTGILVAKAKTPSGVDSVALSNNLDATRSLPVEPKDALRFSLGQRRSDGWGVAQPKTRGRLSPYLHLGRLSALNC